MTQFFVYTLPSYRPVCEGNIATGSLYLRCLSHSLIDLKAF